MKTKVIKVLFSGLPFVLFLFMHSKLNAQNAISVVNAHATIAGIQEGKLSIKKILEAGKVKINSENFTVTKFILSKYINEAYADYSSGSEAFTEDMIAVIKSFKPGEKLLIENVEAKINDGKGSIVKLPGAVIVIE